MGGFLGRRQLAGIVGRWGLILLGLVSANLFTGLSIIILARRVSPLEYGQYTAIFSLATVTAVLPNLGLTGWTLTQPDAAQRFGRRFWYATAGPRLLALIAWAMVLWGVAHLLPAATYPPAIVAPVLVSVLFDSVLMLGFSFLRVRERHGVVTLFQAVAGLSLFALVLAAPLEPGRLWLFAVGRMLVSLLAAGALALYIHRQSPADPAAHEEETPRGRLRETVPFLFAEASSTVYIKADMTIVGLYLGALGASLYGPALNLLTMTFLVAQALFYFVMPRLARQFNRDRADFKRMAGGQLLLQVGAGAAVAVALYLLAPMLVLGLFGPDYAGSIPLLRLLSIIPLLRAGTFGLAAILMAVKRQPERTVVQLGGAFFNVAANLLVIGRFGLVGVAWVFVATEALIVLGHLYLVAGGRLRRQVGGRQEATA